MATHAAESHRAGWTVGAGFLRDLLFGLKEPLRYAAPLWPFALLTIPLLCKLKIHHPVHRALLFLLVLSFLVGPVLQASAWNYGRDHLLLKGVNFMRFKKIMPFVLLLGRPDGFAPASPGKRENPPLHPHAAMDWIRQHREFLRVRIMAAKTHPPGQNAAGVDVAGTLWRPRPGPAGRQHERRGASRCATAGAYHEFHPLFLLASGLETANGYAVIYPRRYNLYWRQVLRPLLQVEPESAGYFTEWGSRTYLFHSMNPENEAMREIPFAAWYDLDLLSLANVRYLVSRKPLADPRLHLVPPIWNLRGTRAMGRALLAGKAARLFLRGQPRPSALCL